MKILNFTIWQHTDLLIRLLFTDAEGAAYDLTDWQFFAEIRKEAATARVHDLAPTVHDPEGGEVRIEVSQATANTLPVGRYKWDILAQMPDGTRVPEPVYGGDVEIKKPITQPTA